MGNLVNVPKEEFEKLKKVMEDKAFVEQFGSLSNLVEMQNALKEKGISLTPEEIYSAAAMIASENSDELDPELLEMVAGGKTISFWIFEINLEKPKWWPW